MTVIRQNAYGGDDWADPILWYARGVQAMKTRPLADVTSWKFYAGIHGYWRWLWDFYGITSPNEPSPAPADVDAYWDQCQHQSWYFLPWHRGYLLALERQIRTEIERLGGPHEDWGLPYWNYFESGRSTIPPAFRTRSWPDGTDDNPLFVEQRWGEMANGPTPLFDRLVHLNPMTDREFSGPGNGGSTGFGGRPTGFNWGGGDDGGAEWQPHNLIHVLLGWWHPTELITPPPSTEPQRAPGLMSHPWAAALDPIFYLHHCNIDRLWESWNFFPTNKHSINPNDWRNPSGGDWRGGPGASGDRVFAMPNPDRSQWLFTPDEMAGATPQGDQGVGALDYVYDDLTPGATVLPDDLLSRVARLGLSPSLAMSEGVAMGEPRTVELLGTGGRGIALAGSAPQRSGVLLDPPAVTRLSSSLSGHVPLAGPPDRVFLNLENVRSRSDAVLFSVYIGLPPGADPLENPDNLAGAVSLFGVSSASDPDGRHAGNGITFVIEVTEIFDRLHLDHALDPEGIGIDLVPVGEVPESAQVEIGAINLYRQSE